MRTALAGCVIVLVACGAFAELQVIEDFESGHSFSAGTVVADPADAGNSVLYVGGGRLAVLALPGGASSDITVSMRVYDGGQSMHDVVSGSADMTGYGFNLGVTGTYNWGVTLLQKAWLNSNGGYGWTHTFFDTWPRVPTSIYSCGYFGGPRQVTSLATVGSGTPESPEIPGVGAWSTWSFTLAPDMTVTVVNDGITNPRVSQPVETAISSIFVIGGKNDSQVLAGVYIDDVMVGTIGGCTGVFGDCDGDGDVDLDDFLLLKNYFGFTAGP